MIYNNAILNLFMCEMRIQ